MNENKKSKKYKYSMFNSISETLEVSKVLRLRDGQIMLSRYSLTTASKASLSLNKNPVCITNLRIHMSAVFFCKKSIKKPSDQISSFLL